AARSDSNAITCTPCSRGSAAHSPPVGGWPCARVVGGDGASAGDGRRCRERDGDYRDAADRRHLRTVARAWAGRFPVSQGGWFGALGYPQMGAALGLIHREPHQPLTIAMLAAAVGSSRSPFAARFRELVGEPPLIYLTRLRMRSAAALLGEGGRRWPRSRNASATSRFPPSARLSSDGLAGESR